LQLKSRQVRVYAVKLDGEGWVGVCTDMARCHGHGHQTPELARLCALHRLGPPAPGTNVVLLPVLPSSNRRRIARASG
jgi:hypothetical protein